MSSNSALERTGISESGFLEGPILITNTHSVGIARALPHDRLQAALRKYGRLPAPAATP